MSYEWTCTCGETYSYEDQKEFVNFCCNENAQKRADLAIEELRKEAEKFLAVLELDKELEGQGIKPLMDDEEEPRT